MKKLFFLLLTAVCALLYAPPLNAADYTFYVDNGDSGWSPVYCYYWPNSPSSFGDSPKGTLVEGTTNIYKITISANSLNGIIFNNGNTGNNNQTGNIENDNLKNGYLYTISKKNNQYYDFSVSTTPYQEPVIDWTDYTIYIKDESEQSEIYLHVYNCQSTDPSQLKNWDNPGETQQINLDSRKMADGTYKMTFKVQKGSGEPKLLVYNGSSAWQTPGAGSSSTTLEDGKLYTVTKDKQLNVSEYNPVTVASVELIKDGTSYSGAVTVAPYQFVLTSLTGTGVYKLKVTLSDGSEKWYIRDNPNDTSNPYTLVEGNETNSFQLNPVNADKIISNAKMTVKFDGTTATSYELDRVEYLSETAHVWLYDGTTAWPMEHRRDGKYVLVDFAPAAGSTYTVMVNLTADDVAAATSYTVGDTSKPLVGGVRPAEEGTTGFSFDPALTDVNVSVRLQKGVPTQISLGDHNGFYTIYLKNRFTDWAPYVRLSSDDYPGYWWTIMTPVKGVRGLYSVTFDPTLYQKVRFLRSDHFDGNSNHQTRRVDVVDGSIYEIGADVIETGDNIGRAVAPTERYVPRVELASIALVSDDGTQTIPFALDDSGNWKATLSSTLTGSYLIRVTGTDPSGNETVTDYTVTDGSISAAPANGAADAVTAGSTPFTLDFNGGNSAVMSLVMNADGSAPTGAFFTDPNQVISALYLIKRGTAAEEAEQLSNPDSRFTTSNGGNTWLWRGKVDRGVNYYLRGINANGTVHIHSIGKDVNYWVFTNKDGKVQYYGANVGVPEGGVYNTNSNWSEQSDWGGNTYSFVFSPDEGQPSEIKIELLTTDNQTKLGRFSYSYEKYTPRASTVYMPLSKSDFAAGPRYFLVGTRTSDWRLQPEWEMIVDDNGMSATLLPGRLMYKQYFGIAKVDSYEDYIMHSYTLYAAKGQSVTASGQSFTLEEVGEDGCTRYADTDTYHNGANRGNYMKWCSDNTNWGAEDWRQAAPALINDATITLDGDGKPTGLTFDYTTDPAEVAKNRAFTLVGANIQYEGVYSFNSGRQRNLNTMTHVRDRNTVNGWQNSWIQSNTGGVPYVDGWGNLLYNTAFDATWLKSHNTVFYNGTKKLTYNSASVTFIPAEQLPDLDKDEYSNLYKVHPASAGGKDLIGAGQNVNVEEFIYKENMIDYGGSRTSINNSNWQCMVVKDMWLDGKFKIWAGWGGHLKCGDDADDGGAEDAARWFYQNGGHGIQSAGKDVSGHAALDNEPAPVYATHLDIKEADFNVPTMRYFTRVILWYNPDKGFEESVVQLISPSVGPNIMAFYNTGAGSKKNTLRYRWWVSTRGTDHDKDIVTGYVIDRYKTLADGTEVLDRGNIESVTFPTPKAVADLKIADDENFDLETDPRVFKFTDDSEMLEAGSQYRYEVRLTMKYRNTEDTGYNDPLTKRARSNRLPIYTLDAPVIMEVKQQTETAADGRTLYSFNVELNAALAAKHADKVINPTADAADQKTVAQALRYYVVTVDDYVYDRLKNASKLTINGVDQPAVDIFQTAGTGEDAVKISDGSPLPPGTRYFRYTVPEGSVGTALNMPTYVWHNVAPNFNGYHAPLNDAQGNSRSEQAYRFYTYLVSEEDFLAAWTTMNFSQAVGSADVIAPPTTLAVETPVLRKAADVTMTETGVDDQVSGTRLIKYTSDGGAHEHTIVDPIHYTRLNEIAADATFDALPVTAEVIENHQIDYAVYVTKAGVTLAEAIKAKEPNMVTVTVPAANTAKSAVITDFDFSGEQDETDVDGHHSYIKGDVAATFDTHLRVAYTPLQNGVPSATTYYNDHDAADKGLEMNFNISKPAATVNKVTAAKYVSQYYHNGPNPQNPNQGACECEECTKPGLEDLGYYAHGVVDLSLTGIDNDSKNAYVGFHAQQQIVNDQYGTCYQIDGENKLYKHSFAGTRAANGGHPVNNTWGGDFNPLTGYSDYVTGTEWSEENDWSTQAVEAGHLPIHVNPIYDFQSKANYEAQAKPDGSMNMAISVIYPVVKADNITLTLGSAPSAVAARAPRAVSSVYLVGAQAPVEVDLSQAVVTGVESILDDDSDAEIEYYNLQGIRVTHPAKGQIYIVRRGSKVSKVVM